MALTLSQIASGFGTGPFGTMPFGTGMSSGTPLVIESVLAVRENAVRVTFNVAPKFTQLGDPNDASDARRYVVTPVDDTFDRLGDPTRPVSVVLVELVDDTGLILDLVLDRPMSSYPGQYNITINNLVTASDLLLMVPATVQFDALFKGIPAPLPEMVVNNRDIANPQTLSAIYDPLPVESSQDLDALLGKYQPDAQGDLAFDEGLVAYKKRVFRRLVTKRGKFAHLPNYGVSVLANVKQLARAGVRESLAFEAEEQIKQEPETVAVSVAIVLDQTKPGLANYRIRARTSAGRTINFGVPVSFSPTGT